MKPPKKIPKMKPECFKNLPTEVITDILLRLPFRSTAICKCVCMSWRYLLETREFIDSQTSKPGLVFWQAFNKYKVFELGDEIDLEGQYEPLTELDSTNSFSSGSTIRGSVNGFIFLHQKVSKYHVFYICNPITREYMKILKREMENHGQYYEGFVNYGFGVSRVSGVYKIIRVVRKFMRDRFRHKSVSICEVYTVGTWEWREIESCPPFGNGGYSNGAFLNGSIHWFVKYFKGTYCILCFDLETETFSTFSLPPLVSERRTDRQMLVALSDYLCISDSAYNEDEVAFWLMKEYGDEKSWTKEFVIRKSPDFVDAFGLSYGHVCPIKVFENGDVLVKWQDLDMFYYSNQTKTTTKVDAFGDFYGRTLLHTPSLISLEKSFPTETVRSFCFLR